MQTTTILLSGGIDSMVVLHLLLQAQKRVDAIFINYGQAALQNESAASANIADHFKIKRHEIIVRFGRDFGAGEVRHRNGMLIFLAAVTSPAEALAIGIHSGVPYADCSSDFLLNADAALMASHRSGTRLVTPLATWNKAQIIAYAKKENLPLELTYSCEAGSFPPCGKCSSCADRVGL